MSSPSPLNYAPGLPLHRRRVLLIWMASLVVLAAAVSARWWEPPAWRHFQILYWQHRCMVYNGPANQLIFNSARSIHIIPREWSNFYSAFSPPGFVSQGTVFLHEMKKPNGQKRLVSVDCTLWQFGLIHGLSRVFVPGTAFRLPRELTTHDDFRFENTADLKVCAGIIDPADSSHFSFREQSGNCEIIYDGWLQNDETIVIGQRK